MGFGEFGGGAFDIAFEGVGGGEATVMGRYGGNGRARSFEPEDRVVGARLQQMRSANLAVPPADARIAGAKADACSASGIASSGEPASILHQPSPIIAYTWLRFNASAVSYSGTASSHRLCARNTVALV